MERRFLEECLAKGLSLETIGELLGKHPSTVSYWLKKYGLAAVGRAAHAPKGNVDVERLRALVEEGASIREMARELSLGYSTVRHWLKRQELETERSLRRKESDAARRAGLRRAYFRCRKHGGRCKICGFSSHPAALQFHHRDPAAKTFNLGF